MFTGHIYTVGVGAKHTYKNKKNITVIQINFSFHSETKEIF